MKPREAFAYRTRGGHELRVSMPHESEPVSKADVDEMVEALQVFVDTLRMQSQAAWRRFQ